MVERLEEGMDLTKDSVGSRVLAPMVPPSLNDSFVVTVYFKVSANANKPWDGFDEQLKTDCFGPSDISCAIQGLPSRNETPRSPTVTDGDGNPEA